MMGRRTCLGVGLVLSLLLCFSEKGLSEERYTVKQGDSLYTVSKTFGVPIETLTKVNGLKSDRLALKQVLVIPSQGDRKMGKPVKNQGGQTVKKRSAGETELYVVRKGDNLYGISKRMSLSIEEIMKANQLHSASLKAGQILSLPKLKVANEEEGEEVEEGDEEDPADTSEGEETKEKQEVPAPAAIWRPEERNLFIRVVKTFLGVPYRLGGSTLKGIDCSAFVKKIYEIFNVQLPRTVREQFSIGKRVGKDELVEGDLVFFKTQTRRANNAHVGIYIGNNEFVHASSHNREVKVDNLDTPYFNKRFLRGVRVKELEREASL